MFGLSNLKISAQDSFPSPPNSHLAADGCRLPSCLCNSNSSNKSNKLMLAHALCSLSVIHNTMLPLFITFKEIEFKKSQIGCLFCQTTTCFINPPMSGWRLSGSSIMLVTRRCATISSQRTLTGGTQAAVNSVAYVRAAAATWSYIFPELGRCLLVHFRDTEDRSVFPAGVLHAPPPPPILMQRIAHVLFRSVTTRRCSEARQQVRTRPGVTLAGRGRASRPRPYLVQSAVRVPALRTWWRWLSGHEHGC